MKRVFVVGLFLVLMIVVAIPAGATQGEEVVFTTTSQHTYWPCCDRFGTWESNGLINSSGLIVDMPKHFGAGWPPGKGFATAHSIEVIGDGNGTISLSAQSKDMTFTPWEPCGVGLMCQHYEGDGRWVVLDGTGEYANLHGTGSVRLVGDATLVLDETSGDYRFQGQQITATYMGTVHFDPR